MLQEPLIFLGIYMISLILKNFLLSDRAGVFKPIAKRVFFIGVFFHEFAHYGMCLAVGRIPKSISFKWRDGKYNQDQNPRGSVEPKDAPSFMQSIVISFAPLYFSTWLIFWLWFGVIFTPLYDPIIKTIAVFVLLSLLLTAAPSHGDIGMISFSFRKDPKHSWYQIFLISFSILVLWLFLVITQITFFLDVFYYLAIAGIYLVLRFSFIGLRKLVIRIDSYNYKKPQKVRFRRFTRRRYKPTKPWKKSE